MAVKSGCSAQRFPILSGQRKPAQRAKAFSPTTPVARYHHFENGFDEKLDYKTLEEAEKAAQGYVDGTMESDGFQYDGAAIFDQQERKYVRIYGNYPDEKAHAQVEAPAQELAIPSEDASRKPPAQNFRITDDALGVGGAKAKYQANINAIKLLKSLESDGIQASPEQQEVLSRYVESTP